jgi:hypothetical protein
MSPENSQPQLTNVDPLSAINAAEQRAAEHVAIVEPEIDAHVGATTPAPVEVDQRSEEEIAAAEERMQEMNDWAEASGAMAEAKARETVDLATKVTDLATNDKAEKAKEAWHEGTREISEGQVVVDSVGAYRSRFGKNLLSDADSHGTVMHESNGTANALRSPRNVRNDNLDHGWRYLDDKPTFH